MVGNKPREQIAIALFVGTTISFFIIIEGVLKTLLGKILILLILIGFIFISLKVLLDPSTDLHLIGNPIRKILKIKLRKK